MFGWPFNFPLSEGTFAPTFQAVCSAQHTQMNTQLPPPPSAQRLDGHTNGNRCGIGDYRMLSLQPHR